MVPSTDGPGHTPITSRQRVHTQKTKTSSSRAYRGMWLWVMLFYRKPGASWSAPIRWAPVHLSHQIRKEKLRHSSEKRGSVNGLKKRQKSWCHEPADARIRSNTQVSAVQTYIQQFNGTYAYSLILEIEYRCSKLKRGNPLSAAFI